VRNKIYSDDGDTALN